ncbi:acetyltransferase [Belliella sp. R4-6]|uniref:Acetyltransferase n=1 Tax=Belliella alkalica TaxID=1730871 RepID=A0ABS9VH56_9BACT|nr:acetyltransferase [Belliella alkalica]MCH7415178.1 acetyltransferase [Belliella alkalica]
MYIYGASGHAKAIIDLLEDQDLVKGVFDDDDNKVSILSYAVKQPKNETLPVDYPYVIGIGDNRIRRRIAVENLEGKKFSSVFHSSAKVSNSVKIGDGTVLMENSIVKIDSIIGEHVIVNTASTIDHDCEIGDYVHIGPGVTLCGGISIGEGTLVGAKSVVLPEVTIGKWCLIGAGSIVHKDVPDGAVWIGSSIKPAL